MNFKNINICLLESIYVEIIYVLLTNNERYSAIALHNSERVLWHSRMDVGCQIRAE